MVLTIDEKRKDFFSVTDARVKGSLVPTRPALTPKQFKDFTLLTDLATRMRSDLRTKGIQVTMDNEQLIEALPIAVHGEKNLVDIKNTVNFYLDMAKTSPLIDTPEQLSLIKDLINQAPTLKQRRTNAPEFINLLVGAITTRLKLVDARSVWGEVNGNYVILIDNRIMLFYRPLPSGHLRPSTTQRGYFSAIEIGSYLSNYWNYGLLGENASRLPHYMKHKRYKRTHGVGTIRVVEENPTNAWQVTIEINPIGFWGDSVDVFEFNNFTPTQIISPSMILNHHQYTEMLGGPA